MLEKVQYTNTIQAIRNKTSNKIPISSIQRRFKKPIIKLWWLAFALKSNYIVR